MNFRFHREFRIFPKLAGGVSRSGPGLTIGIAGFHLSYCRGRLSRVWGVPGSGIFLTSRMGLYTGFHSGHVETPVTPGQQKLANIGAALLTVGAIVAFVITLASVLMWAVS